MASRFDGLTVTEILRFKLASIKKAPLPPGSPSWESIGSVKWEELESGAQQNRPGFKVFKKLLKETRFDR